MAYTQTTATIPDKDKNAIVVALASGVGITSGNAPLHVDPGIGAINDPIATSVTGDLSLSSMTRALLAERLVASKPELTRQCYVPAQLNGIPTTALPNLILSDGGSYANGTGTQPCRLRSIQGISIFRATTAVDYYGVTTATVSPSRDAYALVIADIGGALGPVLTPAVLAALSYDSTPYRIVMSIVLPGTKNGIAATVDASLGARLINQEFGDYGKLFPVGFAIAVSAFPDRYVNLATFNTVGVTTGYNVLATYSLV